MRRSAACSAVVFFGNKHACSNGFPVSAPCLGMAGTPICLQEKVCGRMFPETGKPEMCALPEGYFQADGGQS